MGVIFQTDGLPQEPDFEDKGDLWRGQRKGKQKESNGCHPPDSWLTSGALF